MRKFIMSLTTVASLSLAAVPILGLTQAANAAEPETRIAVGQMNLANPVQAAAFKAQVDDAAKQVCHAKVRAAPREMTFGACMIEVRRDAVSQLSSRQRQALQIAARADAIAVATR